MSSDSTPVQQLPSDACNNPVDLQKIFQHPAGLRTARFIVTAIVKAASNTSADGLFSSVSVPFLGTDGPSSETADRLKDLLAFKDDEEQRDSNIRSTSISVQNPRPLDHFSNSSDIASSVCQMVNEDYSNNIPTTNPSSNRDTSLQRYNASNDYSLATAMESNPSRNGTDSPYRVESPLHAEGNKNRPSLSRSGSNTQSPAYVSLGQGSNQYNIDHPLYPGLSVPGYGKTVNAMVSSASKVGSNHTNAVSRSSVHFPSTNVAGGKELSSIKSFLPVNKGGEAHTMQQRKESRLVNSSVNRRLMPNSLAPTGISNHGGSEFRHGLSNSDAMEITKSTAVTKKRRSKGEADGSQEKKKQRSHEKGEKVKRVPKVKVPKPEPARYQLSTDLWMRIFEFTPPSFIRKARLVCKRFNSMLLDYQNIYFNQRIENFGPDMPAPSENITEKMYNDLISGKGCMEANCEDTKASRTHWSWEVRLCQSCWKSKIEREDRLQKIWQGQLTRNVINSLLECIPVGMHDSYMKPHDYIEDVESRPRGAPRLYRYHFKSDVDKIVEEYEALKAPPYQENPGHSAAEKASALAEHQAQEAESATKRTEFLEQRKARNEQHMKRVVKIETCIRDRRVEVAKPYDANRNARKERFTKAAAIELPDIPIEFVKSTKAYKAAVRIFRDPGTDRGWQLLKPKIQLEWDQSEKKPADESTSGTAADNTTTRDTSVANDSEQASGSGSHQAQHQMDRQSHGNGSYPHFQNMLQAPRNDFVLRTNEPNQYRQAAFLNNQSMMQGYQQHSSASLMMQSSSYPNGNLSGNDFSIPGASMQINQGFMPYSQYPPANSFPNFASTPLQQGSNTRVPINSLLNNPSSSAPQNFESW